MPESDRPENPAAWLSESRRGTHATPYWSAFEDTLRLPDGAAHTYHYVETPGSVIVVPIDAEGRLVLVEQYRYLMGAICREFPGGGCPVGMDPIDAARMELRQETGYDAERWHPAGRFWPCKGLLREECHVYVAEGLMTAPLPPDATESIQVRPVPISEWPARYREGEPIDGMTLAAWQLAEPIVRRILG